jgi:hypothetical protein
MGDTTATETSSATLDFIELLLGTLGFTNDEFVSLGYEDVAGVFHTAVMAPPDAINAAAKIPATANAYFGIDPVRGPARTNAGRGREADVTRLAALWVDLDVKEGGCPSLQVAHAILDDLSTILGTRPSATVSSGHGVHGYWEISDGHVVGGDVGAVRALLKRWGRLVAVVAGKRGVAVDNVFDLARMLRIPGSRNSKSRANGADPLPVIGHPDAGGPLTVAEVDERLTEIGIPEEEDEDGPGRDQVSDPAGWTFADDSCGYMVAFIDGLPGDGPKSGGGRHQWALKQAVRLACGWRLGCLTDADYRRAGQLLGQRLAELRAATGQQVGRFEIANAFTFGVEVTAGKTDGQARAELGDHTHDDTTEAFSMGAAVDDDPEFWSQTDVLAHVHAFARSRGASPYATLGAVLRRVTGCVEPYVVLPPTVGGQVSLNLFTAPVGSSGAGKDTADEAGHDAIDFYVSLGGALVAVDDATRIHPGTGEGLARVFAGRGNQPGETRAHLQVPDIGTLEALADRRGQTLVAQLLAAYMGQPIGFTNNAKDTTTAVAAHRYRLCLSVGVQPENAGFFLSREKDGLPQRFLWLPTNDPGAPRERPAKIKPLSVELPQFTLEDGGARVEMPIPAAVADEIWFHRWQVLTGAKGVNPLDAHLKLTQLKVAAALAVLHGCDEVTGGAWKIAGQLIAVSTTVRATLAGAIRARQRRENTAKAHDQADRREIVEARMVANHQRRVRRAIERKLRRVGRPLAEYELFRACDASIRDEFKFAFAQCVEEGFIVCCEEGSDGRVPRYRLAED